ncbi:MAG TPA: DUF1573 domain-containing protein [Pirellulales bacterium]|nr:DUF1573 domain-containing protein [Pirellulales bacterium]
MRSQRAILLLLVITGCGPRVPAAGPPRIHVRQREIDLGNLPVDRDEPYSVEVRVQNQGESPLRILKISASCGCTSPAIDKAIIEPRGAALLGVKVSRKVPEKRSASVTIETNDPNARYTRIVLSWRAAAAVEFRPNVLDFGALAPGECGEREVELISQDLGDGQSCAVLDIVDARPSLSAFWKNDALRHAQSRKLVVRVVAGDACGSESGRVVVNIGGCKQTMAAVAVRWRVQELLEAFPRSLFLGTGKPDQVYAKSIMVRSQSADGLDIESCIVTGPSPAPGVTPHRINDRTVRLSVVFTAPDVDGALSWVIKLRHSRPVEGELEIPVSLFTKSGS